VARVCPNCSTTNETGDICINCGNYIPREDLTNKKKDKKLKAEISGILSVSPKSIELTELKRNEVKETYLLLTRTDFETDRFSGTVKAPEIPGFKFKTETFEGLRNVINVQIEAKKMEIGILYEGFIEINTTIGEARIPVQLGISGDSPQLGLDYTQLQINLNKKEKSAIFNIVNVGCGTLMGTVKTKTPWLTIDDSSFSLSKDGQAEIVVTLNKKELNKIERRGRMSLEGSVNVETNAGDEEIKIILYLPPKKTLDDYKKYVPTVLISIVLIFLISVSYSTVKKILTPKEIRKTGLWGEMVGENASKKMTQLKWNPFSEAEKLVYTIIKPGEGQLCEIKMDTRVVTVINATGKDRPYTPACSPDGFMFAFGLPDPKGVSKDGKYKCINLAIANEQKLTPNVLTVFPVEGKAINLAYDPVWSPDGMKIAFVKTSSSISLYGDIMILDYNNAEPYNVSSLSEKKIHLLGKSPQWSPDGTKIVFEDLNKEIYIIEPKSRKEKPVITKLTDKDTYNSYCPRWSPEGDKIVFTRDLGKTMKDRGDIYIMDSDGKNMKSVIARADYEDLNPDISPDGKFIAFDSMKYGQEKGDIYIVGSDGKGLKCLTNTPDKNEKVPLWSPDGKKLAYLGYDEKGCEIYIIDMSDKNLSPQKLTSDGNEKSIPTWWDPKHYDRYQKLSSAKAGKNK